MARARPAGRPAHAGDQARRRRGAGEGLPATPATRSPITARGAGTGWPSPAAAASRTSSRTSASRCGRRPRRTRATTSRWPRRASSPPSAAACASSASTRRTGAWSGSPFYEAKLGWYDRLAQWLARAARPTEPLVLGGDFNVAPEDADVWDPRACHGGTHVSPREREAFARLGRWGLRDAYRLHHPEPGPLHVVGLPRGELPQELRHAHRPPAGVGAARRAAWWRRRSTARRARASPFPPTMRPSSSTSTRPGVRSTRAGPRRRGGSPLAAAGPPDPGRMGFPIEPPVEPMLAKLATDLPPRRRAGSSSRSGTASAPSCSATATRVYIQSRDLKPLDRYFPELPPALPGQGPARALRRRRRDRDRGPARPRLRRPAAAPAPRGLARGQAGGGDAGVVRRLRPPGRGRPRPARPSPGRAPGRAGEGPGSGVRVRPRHALHARTARWRGEWFHRFEGAGLDGVIAKHETTTYQPGKRAMVKVKHARTADCVVAGLPLAQERARRAGRARCSSASTTTAGASTTSASPRRSRAAMRRAARPGARAAAQGRPRGSSVAGVGRDGGRDRRACRAARAAGARARTSPGSRCGSSACARSSTTTCRATASGTRTTFQRWRPDKRPDGLPLRPARGHAAGGARGDLPAHEDRRGACIAAGARAAAGPGRRRRRRSGSGWTRRGRRSYYEEGSLTPAQASALLRPARQGRSPTSKSYLRPAAPSGLREGPIVYRVGQSLPYSMTRGRTVSLMLERVRSDSAPYLHETVHVLVPSPHRSVWLSEGFASYVESYVSENIGRLRRPRLQPRPGTAGWTRRPRAGWAARPGAPCSRGWARPASRRRCTRRDGAWPPRSTSCPSRSRSSSCSAGPRARRRRSSPPAIRRPPSPASPDAGGGLEGGLAAVFAGGRA